MKAHLVKQNATLPDRLHVFTLIDAPDSGVPRIAARSGSSVGLSHEIPPCGAFLKACRCRSKFTRACKWCCVVTREEAKAKTLRASRGPHPLVLRSFLFCSFVSLNTAAGTLLVFSVRHPLLFIQSSRSDRLPGPARIGSPGSRSARSSDTLQLNTSHSLFSRTFARCHIRLYTQKKSSQRATEGNADNFLSSNYFCSSQTRYRRGHF